MPQAVAVRAYRKLAYAINDGLLQRWVTPPRFERFVAALADQPGIRFYVIVMPQTLHFLLPCLHLIANDLRVILLLNGVRGWEVDLLRTHWPKLPQFRIVTLPNSSVSHGVMINMLLRHTDRDFGLIDHDLYLFDTTLSAQLRFADNEFLLSLFSGTSADGRWAYPLTHFLYFRIEAFRRLMERHGVGAEIYRRLPESVRGSLAGLGLRDGNPMKSYHEFFDTLHLLLALAYTEGLNVRQIELAEKDGAYHVGGTSIGTHHTKDLVNLYIHLRFIELAGEPLLRRRYASIAAPFDTASELRRRLPRTPEVWHQMQAIDKLIDRLQRAFGANV